MRTKTCSTLFGLILLLAGCAIMQPQFEEPQIRVTSVELIPSQELAPRFKIGLHIINPNRAPLPLKGIVYQVKLADHEVLSGVSNNLPVIAGYGEGDLTLNATADLLGGIHLLSELMSNARTSIPYEFSAKLDIGAILPNIRIKQRGELPLLQDRNP